MRKSILGLIFIWLVSFPLRAEQPIFTISDLDANHGQIIDIDFHVDNFTNIITASYSVHWDPAVLKFRTIKNYNGSVPGLNSSVFGTTQNQVDQGFFTFAWFESSVTPITLPDGSLFYTVEFEVLGDPCDQTSIAITDDPTEILVAEQGEVEVGLVANNGSVNVPGSGCSQDIEFIGSKVIGGCGSNVCVQFTVNNFVDVGAMQFSLVFDPTVLQFDKVQNYAPLMGFGSGNTNLSAPGELRVVWFNGNIENETLPDGTVLFDVCFNVIGTGGQFTDITFGTNPSTPQISDTDGNLYTVTIDPARITAQCALEGFAFIADTVCTQPNGLVCMDIKVNDFDDIIAFQYTMNWDPTKFIFDHVEGFGLAGLDADGFGTPPNLPQGTLTVLWIDLSLQGVTVPDYTTIYRLCLKAIGPVGSASPVTFTGNEIDIEVANEDSTITALTLVHGLAQIKTTCDTGCVVSYVLNTLNPNCPGSSDGVLNLTLTTPGCQCTPTYLWSTTPPVTSQDLTGQPAGNYSVTITVCDQIVIATATLTDPIPMGATINVVSPTPPGSCTGSIDITPTGGTPQYTYQWSSPPGGTTQDLSNLCAGIYTVTITDNNGCTFVPVPIIVGADLSAAISNVSCNGGSNGAINLSVSFGSGPYTYNWNTTPPQSTEDLNNLRAGSYCVTVTDNGGSTRDTCFNVTQPLPLSVSATITHDVNQNSQGAIDLNVTGGTPPISYSWSNGASTQDIIGLSAAQYCVTITYSQICSLDTCFNVFANGFNVALTSTPISCNGDCDADITSTLSGGVAPVTYHWSNNATTANLIDVCAGTYGLTVTDANGQSATSSTVISSPSPLSFNITNTPPTDINASDGALSVVVTGGTPPYTYTWSGPVDGNTAALNNIPGGAYTLLVVDSRGCQKSQFVQVGEPGGPCYDGMSVFTPNSDGKNDFFIITCVLNDPNHLYVFNRQGSLVYETDNFDNNWIGVDQNDEPLPDGGYLWVLEVYGPAGTVTLHKGAVILLRTAD